MLEYTRALNHFRPNYLYGYVSMLDAYAQFLLSKGLQLQHPLKAVIGTSEVLTSTHRRTFEKAFHSPVYNEYGCGEIGTIAHECETGSLHINAENMIVEIVLDGRICEPGELGEIAVTELNNRSLPLVRYMLGDYAQLSRTPCLCGRTLPVLEEIAGRAYDMVCNRQGQRFHGEFFMYIFEEVKRRGLGVQAFQVVQVDYDNIAIRVVPNDAYSAETESLIRQRIQHGYGSEVSIRFTLVKEISREPSGKMRLIVGYRPSP
jgi:phenylacetate-CoA ligase